MNCGTIRCKFMWLAKLHCAKVMKRLSSFHWGVFQEVPETILILPHCTFPDPVKRWDSLTDLTALKTPVAVCCNSTLMDLLQSKSKFKWLKEFS